MHLQALCIILQPSVNSKWSYSRETLNLHQNWRFFVPRDLEIWRMTLKNNRAPFLCYFNLCASFHSHPWIQTEVTVWKRLSLVLTSVTLTFHLWPRPFARISLLALVNTPENFMTIRWWEHSDKGVTDGRTDRRTDERTERSVLRAAWSHLKWQNMFQPCTNYFESVHMYINIYIWFHYGYDNILHGIWL